MDKYQEENLLQYFLTVYFYFLENDLNTIENSLNEIKFQSEESNTDEYLKIFFQKYISKNNDISKSKLKSVTINIGTEFKTIRIEQLNAFKIQNVFLPEQISAELKQVITESKSSVYTNPDLFLEITNGSRTFYESLELKSTLLV